MPQKAYALLGRLVVALGAAVRSLAAGDDSSETSGYPIARIELRSPRSAGRRSQVSRGGHARRMRREAAPPSLGSRGAAASLWWQKCSPCGVALAVLYLGGQGSSRKAGERRRAAPNDQVRERLRPCLGTQDKYPSRCRATGGTANRWNLLTGKCAYPSVLAVCVAGSPPTLRGVGLA